MQDEGLTINSTEFQVMSNGTQGFMSHPRIKDNVPRVPETNFMHEQAPKEPKSHEAFTFNNKNILTNLNPVNQGIEIEQTKQLKGASWEAKYYMKSKTFNPITGRDKQLISCLKCNYTTTILGNMKTHVRFHLSIKPYKCIICEKSFTQKHQLNMHLSKNSCTPAVIVGSLIEPLKN